METDDNPNFLVQNFEASEEKGFVANIVTKTVYDDGMGHVTAHTIWVDR